MTNEFTASSGAKVVINMASFDEAMTLKAALQKQLALSGIKIEAKSMTELKNIDVSQFLDAALLVDSSPVVIDAVFKCLGRCSYNGDKITKTTFEDHAAREDYYDVVIACVKENLAPFFKGLISKLSGLMGQAKITTPPIAP